MATKPFPRAGAWATHDGKVGVLFMSVTKQCVNPDANVRTDESGNTYAIDPGSDEYEAPVYEIEQHEEFHVVDPATGLTAQTKRVAWADTSIAALADIPPVRRGDASAESLAALGYV